MEKPFNELLASIRACQTYDAVKARLAVITEQKAAADDPDVKRALRDAEVYARVWGVAVTSHDDAVASIAIESYAEGNDADFANLINAQESRGSALEAASSAVWSDAKAAASGSPADAVADANAAAEACQDAEPYMAAVAGGQITPANLHLVLQLEQFLNPVRYAASAYLNEQVERARLVDTLKGLLNTYLLVWRKTTTGGGNPLAEQGILESIDEKNGSFVLRSTVYSGQRSTVAISDIGSLDTSRTGPGARQSAVAPGWRNVGLGEWVRSDQYPG